MVHIKIHKGIDLPIEGRSPAKIDSFPLSDFSYDFRPFSHLPLRLAVQEGQHLKRGELLALEEGGLVFVCPIDATVKSIVRGERRCLLEIQLSPNQESAPLDPKMALLQQSKEEILTSLNTSGLLSLFRARPFGFPVHPKEPPRSIFVKAIESAPLTPSAELQVAGNEEAFSTGVRLLSRLGVPVHIVTEENSPLQSLTNDEKIFTHTVSGPHPSANPSLHIAHIDPIKSAKDVIWTLSTHAVISIGNYCLSGNLWSEYVVAICGPGLDQDKRKNIRTFPGFFLKPFFQDHSSIRILSGDPLTGTQVSEQCFCRWSDTVVCVLPESPTPRRPLHFLRFNTPAFSMTHTYCPSHPPSFSTLAHGDVRPYIDGAIYEKVMPFGVMPIQLVKAVLANDFERAIEYGFLEVIPEDFALADFLCPSKNSMMEVMRIGQQKYWDEYMKGGRKHV